MIMISMEDKQNYFRNKIVLLNVFATFMVVALHALPNERFGMNIDASCVVIYLLRAICQVGVPLFFFISAVLFYNTVNSYKDISKKILRRFRTLLVPYLLWNVFFVAVYFVLTNIPSISSHMNMGKAFNGMYDIVVGIVDSRFTPLWFFKILIYYTISAPIIYLIIRSKIVFVFVLISSVGYSLMLEPEVYDNFFLWLPIYLSGAFFGYCKINLAKRTSTLIFLVIMTVIVMILGIYDFEKIIYFRYFMPIAIWIGCDWFMGNFIRERFIVKAWMNCTFFLYCTHYFVLNILEKVAVLHFPPSEIVLVFTLIISFTITVFSLLNIALKLKDRQVYKILTGGR